MQVLVDVSSWRGFVTVSAPGFSLTPPEHLDNHQPFFPRTGSSDSWRDEPLSPSNKVLALIMNIYVVINILVVQIIWYVWHVWTLKTWTELMLWGSQCFAKLNISRVFFRFFNLFVLEIAGEEWKERDKQTPHWSQRSPTRDSIPQPWDMTWV